MLRIVQLSAAEYVRDVLPHSASIWAGDRSFADYAADFGALCASGFGRRRFRTLGLSLGNVKTLIHRGKIALAKRLRERDAAATQRTLPHGGGTHALLLV